MSFILSYYRVTNHQQNPFVYATFLVNNSSFIEEEVTCIKSQRFSIWEDLMKQLTY